MVRIPNSKGFLMSDQCAPYVDIVTFIGEHSSNFVVTFTLMNIIFVHKMKIVISLIWMVFQLERVLQETPQVKMPKNEFWYLLREEVIGWVIYPTSVWVLSTMTFESWSWPKTCQRKVCKKVFGHFQEGCFVCNAPRGIGTKTSMLIVDIHSWFCLELC